MYVNQSEHLSHKIRYGQLEVSRMESKVSSSRRNILGTHDNCTVAQILAIPLMPEL